MPLLLTFACGGEQPEPAAPIATPETTPVAPPPQEEPVVEAPVDPAQKKLEEDRAKMRAEHEQELARWTPELREQTKALIEKKFANPKAAFTAILASAHRRPGNAARDVARKPLETLTFFGIKQTDQVLEYGPGDGWYTELLAPALAAKGKLTITNGNPNGPKEERSTYYAERAALVLQRSPELFGAVGTETIDSKAPKLSTEAYNSVVVMRGLHGMVGAGTLDTWLSAFHDSLKPKGKLLIEQHRAKADADPIASAKQGYLPEAWVIEQVQKAGFKLEAKSEINANPKDTKDYPEGVWALPPSLVRGDQDREALSAIGESDRMTLRFVKIAKK